MGGGIGVGMKWGGSVRIRNAGLVIETRDTKYSISHVNK
jgi:hypothetical protein